MTAATEPEVTAAASGPFEPARYLTRVGGSDYLEVKWRLVWMRDRHPDASIETQLVSHADNTAVFKASIVIPGGGSATGYGSESSGDFRDYLEKAETKAIGRALAALGFGTQFCPDFEFGAAVGRVVDTPVKGRAEPRRSVNGQEVGPRPLPTGQPASVAAIGVNQPAIKSQLDAITRLGGTVREGMTRREAAELIASLQHPQAAKA